MRRCVLKDQIRHSDWWILAPIKKIMSTKAASINKFHFPKPLRIFLMQYLDWLEATFEWSSWDRGYVRGNTLHTYLAKGYYLIAVEESRAKGQWIASRAVAAVSLCHVLRGTSAIFFSIEDSSTIRYKMNIWRFRDCMARIIGVFCAPIIVLSARDTECR